MIYDKIENLPLWAEMLPSLGFALTESKKIADAPFSLGRTEISGNALFASSSEYISAPREGKLFENHHIYIDVQMMIEGEEQIDIIITDDAKADYSAEKDIEFTAFDKNYSTVTLRAGDFLILTPGEWHRPGVTISDGAMCRKTVVKIKK